MESSVMRVNDWLKTRLTIVYKLCVKCKAREYLALRRLLSMPFGVMVGYLFYALIVSRFEFSQTMERLLNYSLVILVAVSYTMSIEIRAICWLSVPTFVGRTGRSYLLAILMATTIAGPVSNTFDNTEQLANTTACFVQLTANHIMKWLSLIGKPILEVILNLLTNQHEFRSFGKRLRDYRKELNRNISSLSNAESDDSNSANNSSTKLNTTDFAESMAEQCHTKITRMLEKCIQHYDNHWFVNVLE